MRDYVLFFINGRRYQISGEAVFSSLSDFLRHDCRLTGTKVVCAEGDCGACTVLIGRPHGDALHYQAVDACIYFLYQLDGKHVVTVEGLHSNGCLSPIQEALIAHHGSQCGYCTPGFVMALTELCEERRQLEAETLRLGLTGNLCRCTGYLPILEAAHAVDPAALQPLGELYPSSAMRKAFREQATVPVLIQCRCRQPGSTATQRTFYSPRRLEDALDFKVRHPEAVLVAGNTELGVLRNKRGFDPPALLSLAEVPGLAEIACVNNTLVVGANVTWTQLERFARDALPEFYKIILRFGSPQIRNVSTLVANVAHGSPIADSLPFLYVTGAELELVGRAGSRRVPINGFYKGYKVKDLAPDEIITQVIIPLPADDELLKLYKVSRRNDLDIATFGAGIRIQQAGDRIQRASIAYSGVAPTVVRLPQSEVFLQGRPFTEETFAEAGRLARMEITPISDVRGSRDFRLQLAENILRRFYYDCQEAKL